MPVQVAEGKVVSQRFDLAKGPLLRCYVRYVGAEQYELYVIVHHIVFDGWSRGLLMNELSRLYVAETAGHGDCCPRWLCSIPTTLFGNIATFAWNLSSTIGGARCAARPLCWNSRPITRGR